VAAARAPFAARRNRQKK